MTIQNDHIHLVVRISRRSNFQNFLRVVSGQAAQQFMRQGLLTVEAVTDTPPRRTASRRLVTDTPGGRERDRRRLVSGTAGKLWSQRPFTRVTRGRRAYRVLQDYVRLNELEARGKIAYRRDRLRNLSSNEREYFESLASKLSVEKGRVAIKVYDRQLL